MAMAMVLITRLGRSSRDALVLNAVELGRRVLPSRTIITYVRMVKICRIEESSEQQIFLQCTSSHWKLDRVGLVSNRPILYIPLFKEKGSTKSSLMDSVHAQGF